jgi:hypothetical protein
LALFELHPKPQNFLSAQSTNNNNNNEVNYNMKLRNKITALFASAVVSGSIAHAEIPLTDELSMYGYVDIWMDSLDSEDQANYGVQEIELGFAFNPAESKFSSVVELSIDGADTFAGGETTTLNTETVTMTYAHTDKLSFTIGNILSYQGFETFDATGLYQYSYSGVGGNALYSAEYAFGASADYVTDDYSAGFWIGDNDGEASIEVLLAYTGIENLTAKFIYADDPGYESFNFWASYDYESFTFAFEYYDDEQIGGAETETLMGLVYYSYGDAGLTLRYVDGEDDGVDYTRLTLSPSYAFSDNVFGLLEFTFEDNDTTGVDSEEFAAELIYTF